MRTTIGIDFGTTNSLCAWYDGEGIVMIPNERGERLTPTVLAFSDSGEQLVGAAAVNQALADPASACFNIKRKLGLEESVQIAGRQYSCVDVAARILRKVRADAEAFLGAEVEEAVISVPARFADPQRRALRAAANLAGLKTARILNEPTAAALAKSWSAIRDTPEGRILVYDFGGGTFDVTVLEMKGTACAVLATEGDSSLGGIDIDRLVCDRIQAAFKADFGIDLEADAYLSRHALDLAERAKIELSTRQETAIAMPFLRGSSGLSHPRTQLSRADFESLAAPLIDRSVELTARVLASTGIQPAEVDMLILSGGSSRIPLIQERLLALGLKSPDARVNPEEVVALGAAVEAARLQNRLSGFSFTDVCSRTYGLEIENGHFIPILPKNTPLPAQRRREFTTVEDYQTAVEIHVLQTLGPASAERVSVGRFLLPGIRRAPKGQARIEVDFHIDESDLLRVQARDIDTGVEQSVLFYEGMEEELPPLQRLSMISSRLQAQAAAQPLDTALSIEIRELLERSAACQAAADGVLAADLLDLLGAVLAELAARQQLVPIHEQ